MDVVRLQILSRKIFIPVIWGGDRGNSAPVIPADNMMLVYSLRTDQWVSSYIAPDPPGNETSSSSIGVIIGAIGGGLVIGLMIGGLYGFSSKRRSKSGSPPPTTTENKDIQPSDNMGIQPSGNWDTRPFSWDIQPPSNRNPHEIVAGTNGKVGTVQLGSVGSKPDPQHPHSIVLESKTANP
ncbi:MAG: hypothetical protein J3Q66DRAFT_422632 [Benniella sp.]|nr:MAG: hypothetical protein J3Q66DRAFT_422632 [Benniella sp.]